jgi:mannose-1-phosphate guanylyltransferase
VLDTSTLDLMPPAVNHSIERAFFPALIARGDRMTGFIHRGYWIDIGTPEKYLQVHRDILRRRFEVKLDGVERAGGWVHAQAEVDAGAELEGPFYVGPGCRVAAQAHLGPDAVLTSGVRVEARARVRDSVLWEGTEVGESSDVEGALLGPGVRTGRHAVAGAGTVLGEGTRLSDYSRSGGR